MSKVLGVVCMAVVFGLSLQAVEAQGDAKGKGKGNKSKKVNVEARFTKLDANGDKKLSKEEFLKGTERLISKIEDKDRAERMRQRATKAFEKHSTDGEMSLDQYKDYQREVMKNVGPNKKKKNRAKATT